MRTIIVLISLVIVSCGTETEPEELKGIWQNEGIENYDINALDYYEPHLFAASKAQLFKARLSEGNKEWTELELTINLQNSEFGDVLLTNEAVYAVVRGTIDLHELPENFISLYKSIDLGENWEPIQITLEGRKKPYVFNRIIQVENTFYGDWHLIFKSDNAKFWSNLNEGARVGVSEFLYVSTDHPNQIWTGGWTNIFSPYLAKSTDGGENWILLDRNISPGFMEATVYDVTISPNNENIVLAGLSNGIFKSTNGGETWKNVYGGFGRPVFQNSIKSNKRVYASGISQSGRLFVAVSNNYGDSWEIEEFEDGPAGVETNDMIVAEIEGKETLFFATNKGVYSLTFEE